MKFTREPLELTAVLEGAKGESDKEIKATVTGDAALVVRYLVYQYNLQIAELQMRLIAEGVGLGELDP